MTATSSEKRPPRKVPIQFSCSHYYDVFYTIFYRMKLLVKTKHKGKEIDSVLFFFLGGGVIIGEIDVRMTLNELLYDSMNIAYTTYIVLVILQTAYP